LKFFDPPYEAAKKVGAPFDLTTGV
jgi:hypothetical protein